MSLVLALSFEESEEPARSSWRFFAFSWSVREVSAWMAWMAETRWAVGATGWWQKVSEQSGQSQWESERERGGEGRHGRCQGVAHVPQERVWEGLGLSLQSMQTPSESHGSCAIFHCQQFRVLFSFIGKSIQISDFPERGNQPFEYFPFPPSISPFPPRALSLLSSSPYFPMDNKYTLPLKKLIIDSLK